MSQETFKLNPVVLRHLRQKIKSSQYALAQLCGMSERQYQRIETNGCTTAQTANRIAMVFNVTIEELQDLPENDDTHWFVTLSFKAYGQLDDGYYTAIHEIQDYIKRFELPHEEAVALHINDQELPIKITVKHLHGKQERTWTMRPVILNEEKGILWAQLSEWQRCCWENQLEELKYDLVKNVTYNNEPVVPKSAKVGYIVDFERKVDNGYSYDGRKHFDSSVTFRVSLADWIDAQHWVLASRPFTNHSAIILQYHGNDDYSHHRIIITKVYQDKQGKFRCAPWPRRHKKQLIASINERKQNTNFQPLPIGIGENCFDDIIPLMAPGHESTTQH